MIYSEELGGYFYQPGDKVRVRATPLPDGTLCFTGKQNYQMSWVSEMDRMCGKIVTIQTIDTIDATYMIEEDDCWWCNEFFEPFNVFDCNDDEGDINPCSFGNYFERFEVI